MASPVVAGATALVSQDLAEKGLTGKKKAAETRARLIGGAIRDNNDALMGKSQSDGRLDVEKALTNPNPVVVEVDQQADNPANATISGFFFGNNPTIELVNANTPDAQATQLEITGTSSNSDGSTAYNVTLPDGLAEGSYYIKATNNENSNWGRMKLSLKGVPEGGESGEGSSDDPGVSSDYFEAVSSLPNDISNLPGIPGDKKVGTTGYLSSMMNVQAVGSKIYVLTSDFYLVDSDASVFDSDDATYLLFVYDTQNKTWSVDETLAGEEYVASVSMAASGDHLYLISEDGVQDYNVKEPSISWLIGGKDTDTLTKQFGQDPQVKTPYFATSCVNGNELWVTNVNMLTLDGDYIESYELLDSVLVYDLSNPQSNPKQMPSLNTGRAGSGLFNIDGSMYLTPGSSYDDDFSYRLYVGMEKLDEGASEWTSVAELPLELYGEQEYIAASAASDGKIIVSGLRAQDPKEDGVVPDTYIYDTQTNTWSIASKQLAPNKIKTPYGVIADDGYFYVIGVDPQDSGSMFSVKRRKVSDLLGPIEDPDNPEPGETITPGENPSDETKPTNALPQTSDPLRDTSKALAVLALAGAIGVAAAAAQKRRMKTNAN